MPTVGKRRLQALCVSSQPSVHTVLGLEVGESSRAAWQMPRTRPPEHRPRPHRSQWPPGRRRRDGGRHRDRLPQRTGVFLVGEHVLGELGGLLDRAPHDGRPKAISARYQNIASRPNTEASASKGTPQGRRSRACSTSSVRAAMEGSTNEGRIWNRSAVAVSAMRLMQCT